MSRKWNKLWHPCFEQRYLGLLKRAEELSIKHPDTFYNHLDYKFFESVTDCIENRIFIDPENIEFRLGNTLGKNNKSWRRVKRGMPDRYRLFFKFSTSNNEIVLAWLNDERSIRKAGSKNDVYEVFKKLLASGKIPNSYSELVKESDKANLWA